MKVLVLEDHILLGKTIKKALEEKCYVVDWCTDGDIGMYHFEESHYDVAIVDWMLPKQSGLEVLGKIRKSGNYTPVLMLTSRGFLADKLNGFAAGADDYLVKPFEMQELFARINALINRSIAKGSKKIEAGELTVDLSHQAVYLKDEIVEVTAKEYEILVLLASQLGVYVKRERLQQNLYPLNEEPESNSIEVLVARVRKKIVHSNIEIRTVRGKGYGLHVVLAQPKV